MANWILGGVMVVVGLLGLFMASSAGDGIIYATGLVLFAFCVLFIFGLIRRNVG